MWRAFGAQEGCSFDTLRALHAYILCFCAFAHWPPPRGFAAHLPTLRGGPVGPEYTDYFLLLRLVWSLPMACHPALVAGSGVSSSCVGC